MSWLSQSAFEKAAKAAYDQDYLGLPDLQVSLRWYTVQLILEQLTKMGNSPHPFTPLMIPTSEALALWGQLQHWRKNFGYHLDKIQLPVPQPLQVHSDPADQPQPSQLATKKRRQQYQVPQDAEAEIRSGTTSNLIQDTPINHLDPIAYVSVGDHLDQSPMPTWEAIKHPDKHREWKEHTEWNATTYNTFTEAIHNHPFAQHLSQVRLCAREDSKRDMQHYAHPWQKYGWQYYVLQELNANELTQPQTSNPFDHTIGSQPASHQDAYDESRMAEPAGQDDDQRPLDPRTSNTTPSSEEFVMETDDVPYPTAD